MKDLIRSEWRRFQFIMVVLAVAHLLLLGALSRAYELPQLHFHEHAAMVAIYMLLGLMLALLQVGSHGSTSRWLWLIHRPLSPARIFAALALSAAAMLTVTVFVPLLVYLVLADTLTTQVIDARHYVMVFYALAFSLMAWLAGAHAATSRHKAAIAVLVVPFLFAWHVASVWRLWLPVLGCLTWLGLAARYSFRADRSASIATTRALLLTALPLQLAFFLLGFQLSRGTLDLIALLGRSPGRTILSTDPNFDADAALRGFTQKFIAKGLARSSDARAITWREQLPALEAATVRPDVERFPLRHQASNVAPPWWDDTRNIKYTFSHDRMRFEGRDPMTGEARESWGASGVGSAQPYNDVPAVDMTRASLYAIDKEAQRQDELVRLDHGEWFVGRPTNGLNHLMILTNKRVLAFRSDSLASVTGPLQLAWQVPLPEGEFAPVADVVQTTHGWLVSLFYFDKREFGGFESFAKPWQQVLYVDGKGAISVVGERRDIRDHNATFGAVETVPLASWWLSPLLYALAHVPDRLDTGLTQPPRLHVLPAEPLFRLLAGMLIIASLAAAYAWLRGTHGSASRRRFWLASCALLGMPAFFSMLCLEPRVSRSRSPRRESVPPNDLLEI